MSAREWAYQNLRALYSESEIANMDDDELRDVVDCYQLPYECPDCGDRHDGMTTGTERCRGCEESNES